MGFAEKNAKANDGGRPPPLESATVIMAAWQLC